MTRERGIQRRTLVRAKNLASFRRALVDLGIEAPPLAACRRVVVVPTRASGELLRQTIESAAAKAGRAAIILPELLTRDDLIARLHAAVPNAGEFVTRIEREVLFARAALETAGRRRLALPPFDVRPGLIGAMIDFYDALRRRQRTVRRFARVLFDELRGERGADRGSEGLIRQTAFLGLTFLAYERALRAHNRLDEHLLRERLLATDPPLPFDHLVVAVADHPSDPRGLWPADFDLIGRLSHLSRLDVVMTDEAHDAGFRERLEHELPDIVEARAPDVPMSPRLIVPGDDPDHIVFVSRDREEELRGVARAIRAERGADGGALPPIAVVFQRPLPYLYLAQQVLGDARIPYQTFDALPLAAEPQAAVLDLALTVARTGGTREAVLGLLRSPHLAIAADGAALDPLDVSALDSLLVLGRVTADASSYPAEVERYAADPLRRRDVSIASARRAAAAAAGIARALEPFRSGTTASLQIMALGAFLRTFGVAPDDDTAASARLRRGRAAVLATLDALGSACRAFDDAARPVDRLAAEIHHAIEAQTFAPRRGEAGVQLADAVSARFGDFDHIFVVGLVETEWPERMRSSIFYGSGLLSSLGWPQEPDHLRAEHAAFRDLLGLARVDIRLSAFQLEGDAIVGLSPMSETARAMTRETPSRPASDVAVFSDELVIGESIPSGLDPEPASWLALRLERPSTTERAYSGFVDPQPGQPYRVSQVDQYVTCPFKYFARSVLQLREEADDSSGLSPLERGTLLHSLFERFYTRWQADGRGAVTMASLPDALTLFTEIASESFAALSPADRALEHTRMLGSIVGRGVAERVFELEADAGVGVQDRLLEKDIRGTFTFPLLGGMSERQIEIRGKADRIDVLEDGTLRIVDYKLGKLPDVDHSIQLAVYAHAIRQLLTREGRADRGVSSAMYLAFGDDRRLEGELGKAGAETSMAVGRLAAEFAGHINGIEAGQFPARPLKTAECAWCAYAGVCRKEYFTSDEAADAV